MNERIKLLAEQAGIKIIPLVIDGVEYEYEDVDMDGSEDLEKFAELIVRECASQVRFTDLLKCNDDSDGEILLQASVQLKQHFGVEE